ncbi:MAG: CBS domain-containing protein [Candidatus Thermoplasmatota archaeon]
MSRTWRNPMGPGDEEGRDMELASILVVVDPAKADPNYWLRFQSWVMEAAAPELARRRLMADLTVGEVMTEAVVEVRPDAPLTRVLQLMVNLKARSFPVTDRDAHLAGIISREDIIRALKESVQRGE